jgi:hypothetical protein
MLSSLNVTYLDIEAEDIQIPQFMELYAQVVRDYSSILNLQLSTGLQDSEILPKVSLNFPLAKRAYDIAQQLRDVFIKTGASGSIPARGEMPGTDIQSGAFDHFEVVGFYSTNGTSEADWIKTEYTQAPYNYTDGKAMYEDVASATAANYYLYIVFFNSDDETLGTTSMTRDPASSWVTIFPAMVKELLTEQRPASQDMDFSGEFPLLYNMIQVIEEIYDAYDTVLSA